MKRTKNAMPELPLGVLATLPDADRDKLLTYWAELCDAPAPTSTVMLRRAVAYKLQEQHHGGLKPTVKRFLEKEAAGTNSSAPVITKPGTRLVRQWHGTTYEVIILPDGVLLDGVHLPSLTEAAYRITDAKWSGPRFFGLVKGGYGGKRKTT